MLIFTQIIVRLYSSIGGQHNDACYDKLGERFIAPPLLCLASDQGERSIARLKREALRVVSEICFRENREP